MSRIALLALCLLLPSLAAASEVKIVYPKAKTAKQAVKKVTTDPPKPSKKLITITEVVDDDTVEALLGNGKRKKTEKRQHSKAVPAPKVASRELTPEELFMTQKDEGAEWAIEPGKPVQTLKPGLAPDSSQAAAVAISLPGEEAARRSTVVTPASLLLGAAEETAARLTPIPPQIECYYTLGRDASRRVEKAEKAQLDRLYFFSDIRGMKGRKVYHVWTRDGQVIQRFPLDIPKEAWRSWSSIPASDAPMGKVTVKLVDEAQTVHASKDIEIR